MAINIHSDSVLRNLRKPGEVVYRIPTGTAEARTFLLLSSCASSDLQAFESPAGGLFRYVSGANFLGEIIEWIGYAIATWSVPALSFSVFSLCFIGPRAYYHHRSVTQ